MTTRFGTLDGVVYGPPDAAVVCVLLHGIGLGPWFWEPWIPAFTAAGVRTIALRMPGHGPGDADIGLTDTVTAVEAALDAIGGAPVLVGHSMAGLVAQILASRRALGAVALVCPLAAGQVRVFPPRRALPGGLALARPFFAGAPLRLGWSLYRALGLELLEEATARDIHARIVPWPNRLCRDLVFARPVVDPALVNVPVLVALGGRDALVPWRQARVLGDLYEAVTWRYDDLGHMPPWEPGGDRLGRDLAAWVAAPSRPKVLESEGYGPAEGVGHTTRRQRRGEEMKRRSAYGQKGSARGT
ncbi:MAG: alpha/beta fold hydrolase [Pseudomonadota bacterium]|nr:alpha/beta fold hydrolase [Pseudomonadota bacterium]